MTTRAQRLHPTPLSQSLTITVRSPNDYRGRSSSTDELYSHHAHHAGRNRTGDSHEDELVGHAGRNGYLELDKDSKSDRNVAMNMI